jgi:hypothetical protein
MRKYLGAVDIANEVRMRRTRWREAFLLVEGRTDSHLYERFVHREGIVVAHGKERVIDCLRILLQDSVAGVVGIVDRDMWILGEGEPPAIDGLLCTDGRDLESMMLRSKALDYILDRMGSPDKLRQIVAAGDSAQDILLRAASKLGYLRWLCERDRRAAEQGAQSALAPDGPLRLRFQELKYSGFTDDKTVTIDLTKLLRAIANHSQQPIHHERIEQELAMLRELAAQRGYSPWDICAGHDLVVLLGIGLRHLFGSRKQEELRILDETLMLAYQDEWFRQTSLYADMQAWQQRHPEHGLLTPA